MISIGLLWFDDDTRRPTTRKIADALERYRDRVGFEPTICLVNTAQLEALQTPTATARPRARRVATVTAAPITLPKTLTLTPSTAMSPNYFMVGVGAGETPRPVRGRITAEEEYEGRGGRGSPSRVPRARSAQAVTLPAVAAIPVAPKQRQNRQAVPPPPMGERSGEGSNLRQKRQTVPPPPVGEGAGGEVRQKRQRTTAPIAAPTPMAAAPATPEMTPKQRQNRQAPTVASSARQKRHSEPSPRVEEGAGGEARRKRQTPATPVASATVTARQKRQTVPPPHVGEGAGGEVTPRQKRQRATALAVVSGTSAAPKQRQKRQAHSPSPPQWGGGQGVGPSERQTPMPAMPARTRKATPQPVKEVAPATRKRRAPASITPAAATNDSTPPTADTQRHTQKRKTA